MTAAQFITQPDATLKLLAVLMKKNNLLENILTEKDIEACTGQCVIVHSKVDAIHLKLMSMDDAQAYADKLAKEQKQPRNILNRNRQNRPGSN